MKSTRDRVDFFDHLRALAVTLVVMAHYVAPIAPGGSIGVSVFFCLSGFLIMSILLREDKITFASAGAFIIRRFMRVFPAYFTTILLMVVLMKISHSDKLPALIDAIPGLLTFTKMPKPIGMETAVFWTLHIEFWFYVTMPFIVKVFGRGRKLMAALLFLIGLSFFFKLSPAMKIGLPDAGPFSALIFWIDNLLYGSLVAVLASRSHFTALRVPRSILIYGALSGLIAIAALISSEERLLVWPLMASAASFLTAIIIVAYIGMDHQFDIFPSLWMSAVVAWVGKISYSIYLYHAIPLDYHTVFAKSFVPLLPLLIVGVAATSYYVVERPGIALGRHLAKLIMASKQGAYAR